MKQNIFKRLALVAVLLLGAITASAYDFNVKGIFYNYNEDGTTVSVTYKDKNYNSYSGAVTIPAYVTYSGITYTVTSIGNNAFYDCSGLTAVEIPNSVTSIGSYAFEDCSGLTAVEIPNSVTSIGEEAFGGCSGLNTIKVQSGNQTYDSRGNCNALIQTATNTLLTGCKSTLIPNSVTSIGESAFRGCSGLTAVEIPNSVTSIGNYAFSYCSGLTAVSIGNSVTTIGYYAFSGCIRLTSVEIPNSVTKIVGYTFSECIGLASVSIGNSVTEIGYYAFSDCSGLTSVSIGKSVAKIGRNAFYGCYGIKKVNICDLKSWCKMEFVDAPPYMSEAKLYLNGVEITDLIIPNSITKIRNYAFRCFINLTSVEIPKSVTEIGSYAFSNCSGLTAVEIPNSVTSIGEYAFSGCSGLTSIEIPNSVTTIGKFAFNCNRLKVVFFNAKNCTASKPVFSANITSFVIGAEVEKIGDNVLYLNYSDEYRSIVSHATTPPVIAKSTFSTVSCPLYVPKGAYAKYWMGDVWGEFADIREIENPVTKIELNKGAINIPLNITTKLTATITPNTATLNQVFWSSDAPSVASVDQSGNVEGLKPGVATITAMAIGGGNGVKATCQVTVVESSIAETLTLNPSELKLAIKQTAKIEPVITPEYTSNKTVEWSVSNADVLPFKSNSDGTITVLGAADGVATITCRTTDGSNLTATCTVTVGTGAVEGIEADAVTVRGENGVIRIEGAEDAKVEVYNAAGVCIYSGTATEITVPQRGIYVVKVAGRTTKLSL